MIPEVQDFSTIAIVPVPTGIEQPFVDRRQNQSPGPGVERRQFNNSYGELSPDSRELANAIDQYKLMHRRRFITYDEMLAVIKSLGYKRD